MSLCKAYRFPSIVWALNMRRNLGLWAQGVLCMHIAAISETANFFKRIKILAHEVE